VPHAVVSFATRALQHEKVSGRTTIAGACASARDDRRERAARAAIVKRWPTTIDDVVETQTR
jgi:hypothetical protein